MEIFEDQRKNNQPDEKEEQIAELERKIVQFTMEVLKKTKLGWIQIAEKASDDQGTGKKIIQTRWFVSFWTIYAAGFITNL